jgi:L-lactate utilization protein LutC
MKSHGLSPLGKLFMQMYSLVARRPRLFTLSQKLAALGTRLMAPFSEYVRLPALTGWGYSKDLPRFAGKTFRERYRLLPAKAATVVKGGTVGQGREREEETAQEPVDHRNALVSVFEEELTKVNGNVIHTSPYELTDKVIDFLKARKITQIHLEPGVLDKPLLEQAEILVSHTPDSTLRVGVTKAVCGLADTGSILIADGEGDPLQTSLLPAIHIAVLCASDILPSLSDAMRLPLVSQSRASVVITGPSRTADIEMSLTIGMHGPGEVHVFLVHGTASTLVDDRRLG